MDKNLAPRSVAEFGFRALMMPTGSPTSQETTVANTAISAVMGPRRTIIVEILSPRSIASPSFPVPMSFIQFRYWTTSGSARPRSSISLARTCGLITVNPSMPNATVTGSPGMTRMTTNMMTVTPNNVGTARSRRLIMYFCI